jgi:hypothetical protein
VSNERSSSVAAFLQSYRTAFQRFDAWGVVNHFAFPSHVTSDADEVALMTVASEDEWLGTVEHLLGMYRRVGVASARILELAVTELSPRLCQAVVHWELRDAAGRQLYRFEATYSLVEINGKLRIAALAHNELPKLRACLNRRRAAVSDA